MNKIVMMIAVGFVAGCNSGIPRGWEYVRIESAVPNETCVYKMQEPCSLPNNKCMNWHKQRAARLHADTVVIVDKENQEAYARSGWTGSAKGGQNSSTLADYYYCNGPKNIQPPKPAE